MEREHRLELYRNGALVLLKDYRRDSGGMEAEIAIYRDLTRLRHRSEVRRFLLYFGLVYVHPDWPKTI
jgi:hypothetical protein